MARLFNDAANEYLEQANPVVTTYPFTLAAWFYTDDNAARQILVSVADSGSGSNYHTLTADGWTGGDPIMARSRTNEGQAFSTSGYSVNTWHHACGVFAANNDRAAFIDGGSKGTDNTVSNDVGIDKTSIGRVSDFSPGNYMSGRIAEAAIWNIALTDAEVAVLGAGFSPLFVRPQNLAAYWSLIRDEDQDRVGDFDMTAFNGPAIAPHPPIIYPAPLALVAPAAIPPGWYRHMSMTGISTQLT